MSMVVCVNFKDLSFSIESLADNKVNISATRLSDGEEYFVNSLQLKQIQSSCIVPALQNKQPQNLLVNLRFNGSSTLELEIIVKYDFIKEMKESIVLARKDAINREQKLKNNLQQASKDLSALTEKIQSIKDQRRVAVMKEVKSYGSKGSKETLLSLSLPPGEYEITFSFFVKLVNKFIDLQFYVDDAKTDGIPGGEIYLNKNAGDVFYPLTLKTVVILEKQGTVSLVTAGKQSYSLFEAKEQVLMAERITDLVDCSNQQSLWEKYKKNLGVVAGVITVAGGILALLLSLLL